MNLLKGKILFLLILLSATSCLDDDNDLTNFYYEAVPIDDIEIPTEFTSGETVEINLSFTRPSACHTFEGFDYRTSNNQITIIAINVVVEGDDSCDLSTEQIIKRPLSFTVGSESSYIFRFWKGKNDESNEDEYTIIEVPVSG